MRRNDLSRLGTSYPTHYLHPAFLQILIRPRKNWPVIKSNALGVIAPCPADKTAYTARVRCTEAHRTRVTGREEYIRCSINAQIRCLRLLFSQHNSCHLGMLNGIILPNDLANFDGDELSAFTQEDCGPKRFARLLFDILTA